MLNNSGIRKSTLIATKQILANVELQSSVGCIVDASLGVQVGSKRIAKAGTPINIDLLNLLTPAKKPAAGDVPPEDVPAGLTKIGGSYRIAGPCSVNTTVSGVFLYADGNELKYAATPPTPGADVWEVFSVDASISQDRGNIAIRNVMTKQFIHIHINEISLANEYDDECNITIWRYNSNEETDTYVSINNLVDTVTRNLHFAIQDKERYGKAHYTDGGFIMNSSSGDHFMFISVKATQDAATGDEQSTGVPMNAVLLHDVDVTEGNANGTALVFGFVNVNRVDSDVAAAITEACNLEGAAPSPTLVFMKA